MMKHMNEDIRKQIFNLLKKEGREMHASEVAEALNLKYPQAYRALVMLAVDGLVECRRVGRKVKLWRVKTVVR